MIQFNLLPDVKLEYIKTRRTKRAVTMISAAIAAASLAVMILLALGVLVFQRQHLKDLTNDINSDKSKLTSISDLNKILTIQNQLQSLSSLHQDKPVASRLLTYMQRVTPVNASVASMNIDFTAHSMTLTGATDSLTTINQFTDTLKFVGYGDGAAKGVWAQQTPYKTGDMVSHDNTIYIALTDNTASSDTEPGTGGGWQGTWKEATKAFSGVVLTSFGKDDKGASYTIQLTFDPAIFDAKQTVNLMVPEGISSQSETQRPGALFQPLSNTQGGN